MGNLHELFQDLRKNAMHYLGATKGSEFEDRLSAKLNRIGFSRLPIDDSVRESLQKTKSVVLDTYSESSMHNPFPDFRQHFILQPYGSQNYPDFLVLDGDSVIYIEVKFSSRGQPNPVWNSGLPRPNGIYIFGKAGIRRDLTFFRGHDVVSSEDAKKLHNFFVELKARQVGFNQMEMSKQPYGFAVYVRKAFEQKTGFNKNAITDFFTNHDRKKLEDGVIEYLSQKTSATPKKLNARALPTGASARHSDG